MPATKIDLPATVPAAVVQRRAAAKPADPTKVAHFAEWRSAITTANTAMGYDAQSPIHGKTDIEVITMIRAEIQDFIDKTSSITEDQLITGIYETLGEMLKRKIAKVEAGKAYRAVVTK